MGVRMSRKPGGGSTKGVTCKFGDSGERGNGGRYGGKTLGDSGWNPEKTQSRMGETRPWAKFPHKYGKRYS